MRDLFTFTLVLLTVFCFGKQAAAQIHTGYCDHAESTAAVQSCLNSHLSDAQKRLNKVYEKLTGTLEGEPLEKLKELQASWLEYRDNECEWEAAQPEAQALQRVYELSCMARVTEDRADLLAVALADNEHVGEQRQFGSFPRWMNALSKDYPDVFWNYGKRTRADLDCDGEDEMVMSGVALSRVKTLEVSEDEMQEDKEGRSPHGLDVVIAIAENPATGRPQAQLFRFPVTKTLDGPNLCAANVALSVYERDIEPSAGEEGEVNGESNKAEDEKEEICLSALKISDKQCEPVSLYWSGKDYALDIEEDETKE